MPISLIDNQCHDHLTCDSSSEEYTPHGNQSSNSSNTGAYKDDVVISVCKDSEKVSLVDQFQLLQIENERLSTLLSASDIELSLAKEALTLTKNEGRRLKLEKGLLLNQLKQVYKTLEDKEIEFRSLIRRFNEQQERNDNTERGTEACIYGNSRNSVELSVLKLEPQSLQQDERSSITLDTSHISMVPFSTVTRVDNNDYVPVHELHNTAAKIQTDSHFLSVNEYVKHKQVSENIFLSGTYPHIRLKHTLINQDNIQSDFTNHISDADIILDRRDVMIDKTYVEKLQLLQQAQQTPLEMWNCEMVIAWLQLTLCMPQYTNYCKSHDCDGKMLCGLSDGELETSMRIRHPMHRRKLRLAVEELRRPHFCRFPFISQMNHTWVSSQLLPDLGLEQYSEQFVASLVDARMLENLRKKDLRKYLGIEHKFHQTSLICGIHVLRILQFDRKLLAQRRNSIDRNDSLFWTNNDFISWSESLGLDVFTAKLKNSGIHGGLLMIGNHFANEIISSLDLSNIDFDLKDFAINELDKIRQNFTSLHTDDIGYPDLIHRSSKQLISSSTLARAFSKSIGSGLHKMFDRSTQSLKHKKLQNRTISRVRRMENCLFEERLTSSPLHRDCRLQDASARHRRIKSIGEIPLPNFTAK